MGNRLSKIYTRTGDKGSTGLADGSRVDKDSQRMQAIGTMDELNSFMGVLLAQLPAQGTPDGAPTRIREILIDVQHALFDLGGELAIPGSAVISPTYTVSLEQSLDAFNQALPSLKEFILPSGGPATAACHVARAVCRRAERCLTTLARDEEVNQESRRYLNRLSDLLFVLARILARGEGGEVYWQRERNHRAGD